MSKEADHVWGHDDARADLVEYGGLFVDHDVEPCPPQEQSR